MSRERLPAWIESERLTFRHWTIDDVPALASAVAKNIEHLRPFMAWIAFEPSSIEDRIARIENWHGLWEAGGDSVLGIFLDGDLIGGTGLHRRIGPGAIEIGYWIDVDQVRRGYATETVRTLTSAAFTVSDIERVEIHHDKANVASAAVPRRLGFTFVGESPREITAPAEVGIEWRWMMSRDEWGERRPAQR